jgi:hypothetical protein
MSKYDYNLYYSDTDSIYIDRLAQRPEKFIKDTRLGALKLEGIYDKAVFLAPKVYALFDSTIQHQIKELEHQLTSIAKGEDEETKNQIIEKIKELSSKENIIKIKD